MDLSLPVKELFASDEEYQWYIDGFRYTHHNTFNAAWDFIRILKTKYPFQQENDKPTNKVESLKDSSDLSRQSDLVESDNIAKDEQEEQKQVEQKPIQVELPSIQAILVQLLSVKQLRKSDKHVEAVKECEKVVNALRDKVEAEQKIQQTINEDKASKPIESDLQGNDQIEVKEESQINTNITQVKETHLSENQKLTFLYLKAQYVLAKLHSKIRDYTKAEFICDQIHQFETSYAQGDPQIYWKYVVKAQYIKAKQMAICMEFRKAKQYLEQEARPILIRIIEKYQTDKKDQDIKVLIDNKYSFEYRKQFAKYLKKFAFFQEAADQLNNILSDERKFYEIENECELESMKKIDLEDEKYLLHSKSNPLQQMAYTHRLLAVTYSCHYKKELAVEHFGKSMAIYKYVFDNNNAPNFKYVSLHIDQAMCYIKCNLQQLLEEDQVKLSENEIFQAQDNLSRLFGGVEEKTYKWAQCMLTLGEVYSQSKQMEKAEDSLLKAQNIAGLLYSDHHPAIIQFNTALIELYGSSTEEPNVSKCIQIAKKNAEIAQKYYGEESIYCVKTEFDLISNLVSQGNIEESQDSMSRLRKLIQRFHDDDPKDLMNQYFFLTQILIAITLMGSTSQDAAERILSYVFSKQLQYCENDSTHPFMEQTILNLAIHFRANEQYMGALSLFNTLKGIQQKMFGVEAEALVYTYKNIGLCYLAIQNSEKAEENYLKALDIVEKLKAKRKPNSPEQQVQMQKEDYEQLASTYFNLYLSAIQKDKKDKCKEYNMKCLQYHILAKGDDKNLSCSNCYFIQAQLELKTLSLDEAIKYIEKALSLFDSIDLTSLNRRPDELYLIKIRYHLSASNIYFIKGDYVKAKDQLQQGLKICEDDKKFTYGTIKDVKAHKRELTNNLLKCEAKLQGVSTLDLKPLEKVLTQSALKPELVEGQEETEQKVLIAEAKSFNPAHLISTFGLVSSTSFLACYLFLKNKQ
eukprot:403361289